MVREVANFMRIYPAYTLRATLDLYAKVFYTLLNEGYRLQSSDYIMLAHISDLPQMEKSSREEFFRDLKWASTHPGDILKPSGEGSSSAEIKKALGG